MIRLPQTFWDEVKRRVIAWHSTISTAPHGATGGGGGVTSHGALTGVTPDQHHNQSHAINGGDHTGGTAVLTTDADYIDLTDGGATALHSHAGSVDTVDLWLKGIFGT